MVISGSGNVAIYACRKGACSWARRSWPCPTPTATSMIPTASTWLLIKEIKEVERARIKEYCAQNVPGAKYIEGQRHLVHPLRHRSALRHPERAGRATTPKCWSTNGCYGGVPRAPTCPLPPKQSKCLARQPASSIAPGKAANAGGVATSGLEMSQNSHALRLDLRGSGCQAA